MSIWKKKTFKKLNVRNTWASKSNFRVRTISFCNAGPAVLFSISEIAEDTQENCLEDKSHCFILFFSFLHPDPAQYFDLKDLNLNWIYQLHYDQRLWHACTVWRYEHMAQTHTHLTVKCFPFSYVIWCCLC